MLLNNQLKDVESWAGKGNKSANANIAVLEAGVNYICSCHPRVVLHIHHALLPWRTPENALAAFMSM